MGGLNYFANLIGALQKMEDRVITPYLILRHDESMSLPDELHQTNKIFIAWPGLSSLGQTLEHFGHCLEKEGIELLSHAPPTFQSLRIPTIGWIPDFQHHKMPWMFDSNEIEQRNKSFSKTIEGADKIIVSSESAKRDLLEFMPCDSTRLEVLVFRSNIFAQKMATWGELEIAYNIPEKYFFLPNQFWKHKNHEIILDALLHLFERASSIKIICTGCTEDYRHPDYFPSLQARINEWGLNSQIKILGLVPRTHFNRLMANAVAVLQPSLFEGWSTTVEEARALGKTLIISDILVHREQAPMKAHWFDPVDPIQLSEVMLSVWRSHKIKSKPSVDDKAIKNAKIAYQTFGEKFAAIALAAINSRDIQDI